MEDEKFEDKVKRLEAEIDRLESLHATDTVQRAKIDLCKEKSIIYATLGEMYEKEFQKSVGFNWKRKYLTEDNWNLLKLAKKYFLNASAFNVDNSTGLPTIGNMYYNARAQYVDDLLNDNMGNRWL